MRWCLGIPLTGVYICIAYKQTLMKNNPFLLMILFIFLFGSKQMIAQDETKSYKNALTFNITRLALMEARFGYERQLTEKHVLRSSLGIQFPISSTSFPDGFYVPFYYVVSKGVYFSFGYNYIFNTRKKLYVSTEAYYNYSYYDNKYYEYCTGQSKESYVNLQSMILNKTGIKVLFGKKLSTSPSKNTRLQFDLFAGIGIQYRAEEITIYKKKQGECSVEEQYDYYVYNPPEEEISIGWWPTINAGILLSLPF